MNDRSWTVENHPHPQWTIPGWFLVAPRRSPRSEMEPHLIGYVLPDGRRAYAFPTQEQAQRAADARGARRVAEDIAALTYEDYAIDGEEAI